MNHHGSSRPFQVALIGNPNSGKSTVFNELTGLRQKTGNFPGVTVDIKQGRLRFPSGQEALLIDFPGTYSLYPTASDEKIVASVLTDPTNPHYPDAVVYVADVTHLDKHLLLLTQMLDLGLPVLLALNMSDSADALGITVHTNQLSERLGIPVVSISGRTGLNIQRLLVELEKMLVAPRNSDRAPFYTLTETERQVADAIRQNLAVDNPYRALLLAHHASWLPYLSGSARETLTAIGQTKNFQSLRFQVDETLDRYDHFMPIVEDAVKHPPPEITNTTDRIDAVLTHRVGGPLIFVGVMLLVFQAIYDWSTLPMEWIEALFSNLNNSIKTILPEHWLTDLLTEGILAGLGGILVFVPQIAILFFLITLLEEVGYMARVVFMFDKFMRRFGMNGRSLVSLISGGACAVPAIMSSRTIGNWQERLITVLVTPFISCSARLPVYAVLIGLAVPDKRVLGGILGLQSLTFASMYLLGVLAALGSGFLMKKYLHRRDPSFLAIELPVYRMPHWRNVWLTLWEKTSAFVVGAGQVILVISVILWALASFGPSGSMDAAVQQAENQAKIENLSHSEAENLIASYQLENSYAGRLGKWIEPAIRPLGYDWKIGIALITSFAAREVFIGTMATIYSIGSAEDDFALRQRMDEATFTGTNRKVYTLATALSLLVFYALAMQCMSTLAVVRRETGSWKWPLVQFVFMSALAYLGAWLVYQIFA